MTTFTTSPASAIVPSRKGPLLILAACTGCYCVVNATWWMQPVLIEQFVGIRGLSASAAGLIVSAELTSQATTSFVLAKILKGGRFLRLAALGTVLAIVASFISLRLSSYPGLLIARVFVGIGEGIAFMVANTAPACLPDRDRAFARMQLVNAVFGVVLVSLAPIASNQGGAPSGLMALLISLCALLPIVLLMPPSLSLVSEEPLHESPAAQASPKSEVRLRIGLLSVATFAVGLASGIMWSFYGLIGEQTGLSATAVNNAIAASIFSAIPTTFLAAVLGKSFGRLIPVSIALALMTGAIAALSLHPGPYAFRIGTCVMIATLYFTVPYLFAAGSVQDASGRGATFVGSAFLMSGAISPYIGGFLFESASTEVVGGLVVLTSIIAWLAFAYVDRLPRAQLTVQ
jgi:hypothetical protein